MCICVEVVKLFIFCHVITTNHNFFLMKRLLFLAIWACLGLGSLWAQQPEQPEQSATQIIGRILDKDTHEGVMQVTLQLLRQDSTFVGGVISDEEGNFTLPVDSAGQYILRLTSVGYIPLLKNIRVRQGEQMHLGDIIFQSDAIMLKGTTVTGQAAKVVVKEDTFIYNASAYRTPEGAAIEELVKRLPGAQVGDDGKITINGKEVKKIKVDGKEFMTGDTQTALKNLPTSIVERVRAYDEKSDLARITGIDDGEEETVLDFGIKPGMNKGLTGNADLGIGTKKRYSERLMAAYFNSDIRLMLFGNANNTNDMGFPGGGGGRRFGANQDGLNQSKMLGVNFNYVGSDKLKWDASVRWNHRNSDVLSNRATENFVSIAKSFSNSLNQSYNRNNSWNGQMRIEWEPDTMTNIMFRPSISYSTSDGTRIQRSAQFNDNPYDYVDNPLDDEDIDKMAAQNIMVNTQKDGSISYGENTNANAMIQFNRKLDDKGRNVTLRTDLSYGKNDNTQLSVSDVHLYQIKNYLGLDSTYQTNRYNTTPTKNWSYAFQVTYSEPIAKAMFLQFSYRYQYRYNKSDRATYDFSDMGQAFSEGLSPGYRMWDAYLARLTSPLDTYLDEDLSRFSEYKNYIHEIQLTYRWIQPNFQLNAGFMVQPQKSKYTQDYQGVHVDMDRSVTNVSPMINFLYRFSKLSNLRINYRGRSSQPNMSDLLDITDDSDPLNITKGNPGLKPSFTHNMRVNYNNYIQSHQRSIMAFGNLNITRNSISNMVTYNENTGGRTTRPENINGNWSTQLGLMFNTSIDSTGYWNVNTFTNYSYNQSVGYLSIGMNQDSQRNYTRTTTLGERLSTSFRNSWLEVDLNGEMTYMHARNKLQPNSDLDTWQFSYGLNLNVYLPWGSSLSSDIHENSRRGYSDKSMNTNELIWNAQLSHSFMKGNLSVTLQFYDILHQQSNLTRTINAMMRQDTEYNSINHYAMLHVIYKFNFFGGKDPMSERRGMFGPGGMPMGGMPGGGMPGGGGRPTGGGRPSGGGGFGGGGGFPGGGGGFPGGGGRF